MGLVTATTVYVTGDEHHDITVVFALVVVIWAIGKAFLEAYFLKGTG